MIPRLHEARVRDQLRRYPAVALLGPRQCGKTTLARHIGGEYFDMEDTGSETRLDAEWERLASGTRLVVIDEAHRAPRVFSRLRGAIDADRGRNGRFLLLGSVSPELQKSVSESLAGRLAVFRLSPLLLPELGPGRIDDLWLRGGFPDGGILDAAMFPDWQSHYIDALVSRDLPNWGFPARPRAAMRLIAMIAAIHAQPLNASQLGAALSLDHKTVLRYCDFLEGAFLIRRLSPFVANIRKRLVKRPRVFWRDSGLMHALLGVVDLEHLYRQPWLGHSWEGFVIEQTLATLEAIGRRARAHFFRTSDGTELDLVLEEGRERWAVEVKLTSAPSSEMTRKLTDTGTLIGATRCFLVCRIADPFENERLLVTDLAGWLDVLRS